MTIKKRFFIIPSVVAAAVAAAVLVLFYVFFYRGFSYDGIIAGDVAHNVEITRDDNGVPQIKAKTREDAFFALGFCHAQDRYNLMEYYRAMARGKVAPMVEDDGADLDRLSQIIGFSRKAREIRDTLAEPFRGYLKHYAKGINAARDKAINVKLDGDEWNETDIIAILVMKEWANAFLNNRELYFAIPKSAQSKELEDVFPQNMVLYYDVKERDSAAIIDQIGALVRKYMGSFNRGMAFYVPAKDSQSDEYLTGVTCDDDLAVYPGWYPASIVVDDVTIKGVTHVGMPFVFSGSNQFFSFCGFNLNVDTQDFCTEQVRKLKDMVQYLSATGWRSYEAVNIPADAVSGREGIAVVWSTVNGPVLNDVFPNKFFQSDAVTLKALFPGSDYLKSLFTVPFSKNAEEAAFSLQNVNSLPRVYLINTDDHSLTIYSGKVPLRNAGQDLLRQGTEVIWNGIFDISGTRTRTPFTSIVHSADADGLPQAVRGYCVADTGRADRLRQLLEGSLKMSLRDIETILNDRRSATAEKFVPDFINILKDIPVTSSRLARIYFQEWDYSMDEDMVAPTLYEAIMQNFIYETLSDEIPEKIDAVMKNYHLMMPSFYEVMKMNTSKIFDDVRTNETEETMESIFDRAFLKALRKMSRSKGPFIEDWKWGGLHTGRFMLPFNDSSIVGRLLFPVDDRPYSGGNSTIYYSSVGKDFKPERVTSMVGIFNSSISRINMHFAYSTSPRSRFYYGRMEDVISFDLTYQNKEYLFRILPLK